MSQEDIDHVRDAWAAISENDLEHFLAVVDPEVEFTSLVAEADAVTYRGHDGVRRWWASIREAFAEFWADEIDAQQVGDHILAYIRLCGKIDGTQVEQSIWQVLTAKDGLVVYWSIYRSQEEAMREISRIERSGRYERL